jgi:hypothetical protein
MNIEKLFEEVLKEGKMTGLERELATEMNHVILDFIKSKSIKSQRTARNLVDNAIKRMNFSWMDDYFDEAGMGYMGKQYSYSD